MESFHEMTADITSHPLFLQLRAYPHHGGENSLYIHSVSTARCAYRLARRFHMREERIRAVTRAALLHDFFGYDWPSERHRRVLPLSTGPTRPGGRGGCLIWTSASVRPSPATCSPWPPGPRPPRPGC